MTEKPMLSPKELAARLGVSDRTVRQMLHTRTIASYKVGGRRRIDPRDVDIYLKNHRTAAG